VDRKDRVLAVINDEGAYGAADIESSELAQQWRDVAPADGPTARFRSASPPPTCLSPTPQSCQLGCLAGGLAHARRVGQTAVMGFMIFRPDEREFQAALRGDLRRSRASLSEALHTMRANIWRLPPGARGSRHVEHAQEEMFVVLEGAATLLLGDPPERVELPCGTVAVVETGTAQQLHNESEAETVVLIVGAPPAQGQAEHLPDAE